jgi:hypothetical protein
MRTKQFLLATALAAVVAATGAQAAPDDQHHPQQAATPYQQGAEGTAPAMPGGNAGAAPQTGGEPDTGMMGPGMMGPGQQGWQMGPGMMGPGYYGMGPGMMGPGMMGMMGMMGGGPMMNTPAPGVTIIINMPGAPTMQVPMMMGAGETAQGPAARGYEAAMNRMHRGMAVTISGDADVDFARMMIPHHQGAIDMARVELAQGKDPALRAMAQDIIKAQEGEIATLKDWLDKHPR